MMSSLGLNNLVVIVITSASRAGGFIWIVLMSSSRKLCEKVLNVVRNGYVDSVCVKSSCLSMRLDGCEH